MSDILHRVAIKSTPDRVYSAIATVEGVAGWWTRETTGRSAIGKTMTVIFRDHDAETEKGRVDLAVVALEPDRRVHWRCTAGPDEWVGTDMTFSLAQAGEHTVVLFGHRNWWEPVEFMAHCSTKWAVFLLSLKDLVETGEGRPSPDDLKIDNWN